MCSKYWHHSRFRHLTWSGWPMSSFEENGDSSYDILRLLHLTSNHESWDENLFEIQIAMSLRQFLNRSSGQKWLWGLGAHLVNKQCKFKSMLLYKELESLKLVIYKSCDWSRSWRWSTFILHQTTRARGTKKILMDENSTRHPTCHQVDIISWSTRCCIGPSQKNGSVAFRGCNEG